MHLRYFIGFFVFVAKSDGQSLVFHPNEMMLAECIEQQILKSGVQFQSTSIVNDVAYLAARRYCGKTIAIGVFNTRFKNFFHDLRSNRVTHEISQDQLSEPLRAVMKQALIVCGGDSPGSSTISENKKSAVGFQNNEWISFSLDKKLLATCIESHLKLTGVREFNLENGFTKVIADWAANRHNGKSMLRKNFNKKNKNFFYDLHRRKGFYKINIDELPERLKVLITRALEDCAVDGPHLAAVPTFQVEPPEITHLLDLILVTWPEDLRIMIQSRNGRRVLRRYFSDAWTAFTRELNNCQNDTRTLRFALRSFWINRAQQFYDAYSVEPPYILHRYTLNHPTPHMIQSNFDKLTYRKSMNFNARNPLLPTSFVNRILNIYKFDGTYNKTDRDIFDGYRSNGMTHAEYYLENKMNQFYRILFYFMELCARGICTDEDDFYYGNLPNSCVPEKIQAIIYDDDTYRDYLLVERFLYKMLMEADTQNEVNQILFESARVIEENLLLLKSNILLTKGYKSKSLGAATEKTTSTTTQSPKRKDEVWRNKNGKCFPKRFKMSTFSDVGSISENMDTNYFNEVTQPPVQEVLDLSVTNSPPVQEVLDLSVTNSPPVQEVLDLSVTNSTDEDFMTYFEFCTSQQLEKLRTNNYFGYVILNNENLSKN